MKRVFIIHPFIPAYRKGLYERLAKILACKEIEFRVIENVPPPRLSARSDSITGSWAMKVPCLWIDFMGRDVAIRDLRSLDLKQGDYVVVEQAIKNLETYPLLARAPREGYQVAMWGHGKTYSTRQSAPFRFLKTKLTNRADWFFAYTSAGANHVELQGFPANRITVLNNTIDTEELYLGLKSVSDFEVSEAITNWKLTPGRTALFLGGVDESKGIDFLIDTSRAIEENLPGFRLIIGGTGSSQGAVTRAEMAGYPIVSLGRLSGHNKFVALRVADILMIPEWIGLVAVDSLVSQTPIVSTNHRSHSPEVEYLENEINSAFSAHSVLDYSRLVTRILTDGSELKRLRQGALRSSERLGIDQMTSNFIGGLEMWSDSSCD